MRLRFRSYSIWCIRFAVVTDANIEHAEATSKQNIKCNDALQ